MKIFFSSLLALSTLFFCHSQTKQKDSIVINHNTIDDMSIEPYKVIWSQDVIEPGGKKRKGINTITDNVTIDTILGKLHIKRALKWEDTNNNVYIKSDVLDYKTLKPVAVDIRWNPNYIQHSDIKSNTVISTTIRNAFATNKVSVTPLDIIGLTWSSDGFPLVVTKNIPIGKFYMQTINGLPHSPKLGIKVFDYQKNETIQINTINYKTRVISDISGGNTKATYWVSDQKPYIIKVQFEQPDGQITTWKLDHIE